MPAGPTPRALPALGVEMLFVAVRSSDEFDSAFAAMMRQRPDAFTMTGDPLHQVHIGWIIDFLARNRLPGMYQYRENVIAGGHLPVEQPTKFDLTVNLKTAKALGLTIPEALQEVTRAVPIVFVQVTDPVSRGLVASLARPRGNMTGFVQFEFAICGKWLELLNSRMDAPTAGF